MPTERAMHQLPGVLGVEQPQADGLVAEQVPGAADDRVQHLLEVMAADDRALNLREPLEQTLALLERFEQSLVLGALAIAQRAQPALGVDHAAAGARSAPAPCAMPRARLRSSEEKTGSPWRARTSASQLLVVDRGRERMALADPAHREPFALAAADQLDRLQR